VHVGCLVNFPNKGWKLGTINTLIMKIQRTVKIDRPGRGRHIALLPVNKKNTENVARPGAQSGRQSKNAPIDL